MRRVLPFHLRAVVAATALTATAVVVPTVSATPAMATATPGSPPRRRDG